MNRTPLALIAAAWAMATVPALAAPGEILLHIDARGSVAPDLFVMPVPLEGTGSTREEALAALDANKANTLRELSAMGIDGSAGLMSEAIATQIAPVCATVEECALTDAVADAAVAAADAAADEKPKKPKRKSKKQREAELAWATLPTWSASAVLTVETEVAKLDALRGSNLSGTTEMQMAMMGLGGQMFSFRDPVAARAAALDKAMVSARADADAYAAALGYRVVRVAGVSNAAAPFAATDLVTLFTKMDGPRRDPLFAASIYANVGIDFVIAPK